MRTDLVTMAILADKYAALVELEGGEEWGECTDKASQKGTHKRLKNCLFCGGLQ